MTGTHYFNFLPKQLDEDEEEIFYRHPEHPFAVNQLGVIFPDEGYTINYLWSHEKIKIVRVQGNVPIISTSKGHLVLECYEGRKLLRSQRLWVPIDGNPYNFAYENIKLTSSLSHKQFIDSRMRARIFKERSENYIFNKEDQLVRLGIDVGLYWSHFKLPSWLAAKATKIDKPGHKPVTTKMSRYNTSTPNPKNLAKMEQVLTLKKSGMGNTEIQHTLGFPHKSTVRYWLCRAKAIGFDI